MNIMFSNSITDEVKSKYTLLELDKFYFSDTQRVDTAFCLVENIPIQEMFSVDKMLELHDNLMKNFRERNWKYCEDALEHLTGKWNNELDSFYQVLTERIAYFKDNDPGDDWSGVIMAATQPASGDE